MICYLVAAIQAAGRTQRKALGEEQQKHFMVDANSVSERSRRLCFCIYNGP